jgi:hypothetical protein
MKTFRTAILIAGILVAGLAYNTMAQTYPENEKPVKVKTFKSKDKAYKHELKHELKQETKIRHKDHKVHKHEFKHAAKLHKADAKVHKAKIRPHEKFKAKSIKQKV